MKKAFRFDGFDVNATESSSSTLPFDKWKLSHFKAYFNSHLLSELQVMLRKSNLRTLWLRTCMKDFTHQHPKDYQEGCFCSSRDSANPITSCFCCTNARDEGTSSHSDLKASQRCGDSRDC